jgi:hypothetical protein
MRTGIFASLLFLASFSAAQSKEYKFGKVSATDFSPRAYPLDSNAAAVVLADIGSSELTGNTKGTFSLLFRNYRRAHILNKNGFEISNVSIPLLRVGDREEKLEQLKAVTYNLENGKVVETKLDVKDAVFKDVIDRNWVVRKFTFPNVKEGSIIEYEYRVMSDFYQNLQGWSFQGEFPVLWSEYEIRVPDFLSYLTIAQGQQNFAVRDQSTISQAFDMADGRGVGRTERISFNATINRTKWAMQNVPALKVESYTSTIRNHISRIQFQLSSIGYPFEPRQIMSTWPRVTNALLADEEFGANLEKDNGWLNDVMGEATGDSGESLAKAKSIFYWVRDHFSCTDHSRLYMKNTLKNVLKNRNGSVAEINLLLTAILKKAGIKADPVILGTRSHGYTHPVYPIMERFNYVICRTEIDGKSYYLDASETFNGFGRVGYECYNGFAVMVNPEATPIQMNAVDLKEESYVSIFMSNDDKGNLIGTVKMQPGYIESTNIREEVKEKGEAAYEANIVKKHGGDYKISELKFENLKNLDEGVSLSYNMDFTGEKEDILYVNPLFGKGYSENPFKSEKRLYPVEMPFSLDETINVTIMVPAGYVVDELPKQAIVKFNDAGDAQFEYRLSQNGDIISLRSRLKISRTIFHPDEYEILREFFNLIVTKQNEQIVFKKKP